MECEVGSSAREIVKNKDKKLTLDFFLFPASQRCPKIYSTPRCVKKTSVPPRLFIQEWNNSSPSMVLMLSKDGKLVVLRLPFVLDLTSRQKRTRDFAETGPRGKTYFGGK